MWGELTSDEKNMLLEDPDNIEVTKDSLLSIENDTAIGRAVLNGDTTELDSVAAIYSYNEWLSDNFGTLMINSPSVIESDIDFQETVSANFAIDYLSKLEDWDEVEKILTDLNSEITVKDVKNKYNEMTLSLELLQKYGAASRASTTVDYQNKPIRKNVGKTLRNGTVILTCFNKKAYPVIGGKWAHAGIFSEAEFKKRGGTDRASCVYTAQPDVYGDFPDFMKPDRPNYCCLDTICMYSYQKKMATLIPKSYSYAKAAEAVKYAEEAFYNKNEVIYNIPVQEYFQIGDTSHDMTVRNPYCSKVVYSAWRKAGINLDSNTSCGNLISPDDLYGSAFNRYITVTIRFLWWSKSWTKQTYSATSTILTEERQ